jgi:hypothetical protein
MAESRPSSKTCAHPGPEGRPQGRPRRPASHAAISTLHRPCWHIKDLALGLESDLSSDMAVGDQELDAITRLLGDALDELLFGS